MFGQGGASANGYENAGVVISDSEVGSFETGDVNIKGNGGLGEEYAYGVYLTDGGSIVSGGNIAVDGTGGGSAGSVYNVGVMFYIGVDSIAASGTGNISVIGTGGAGGSYQVGVDLDSAGSSIRSDGGDVTVTGTGGSGGHSDYGVNLWDSTITSGGDGAVSVTGTGGSTGSQYSNFGVSLQDGSMIAAAGTGDVTVVGTGGASSYGSNIGVYLHSSTITSGGGAVTVTGTGGPGEHSNFGVLLSDSTISSGGDGAVERHRRVAGRRRR